MTKPIDQMTTEELVKALKPCECGHLTTDHEADGLLCKGQVRYVLGWGRCGCTKYVEKVWE